MKRLGLFLLAVMMVAGCGPDFPEFVWPTVENTAGIYNLTKVTEATSTFVPPDISGKINLTTAGRYNADYTIRGNRTTASGTFWIEIPEGYGLSIKRNGAFDDDERTAHIVFDNGVSGHIQPYGFKFNTYGGFKPDTPVEILTLEFTRS